MSQTTTSAPALSSPNALDATLALLRELSLYQAADQATRTALEADCECCLAEELPGEEYLDALSSWQGTAEEYLAECQAEHDTALEHEPAPAIGQGVDASRAAEALAKAKQSAEEQEQQTRTAVAEAVKSMVRSYCKGERAYARGLLEAGYYAHLAVQGKLRLGDKRKAAVQLVEGQLALHASDTVDANRLIRCWAAWHLLCEETGLQEQAKAVPYGHYRDAWCKLVERSNPDTAAESYTLLPGLEEQCKAVFRGAVDGQLSKDACHEQCQLLVRQAQARAKEQAEAAAKQAAEAKSRADEQAREAAAREKAAQQAKQETLAAVQEAKEQGQEEAAALALAEHQKATQEAEAARKQREAADFQQQQAAREAARKDQEARDASRKEAEAEAKRAKAAERKATVKAPDPECRAGQNLLASARHGTAKDVAAMALELVTGGDEPDSVLEALLHALDGHKALCKGSHRAIKAALVSLAARPTASPTATPALAPAPQQATVKVPDQTAAA